MARGFASVVRSGTVRGMRTYEIINAIAEGQHGCVAAWQLIDAGLTSGQVVTARKHGVLTTTLRGVYRTPGTPDTWDSQLAQTVLACGPGSAASHRAAARLHRMIRTDPIVEVCTPRHRRLHGIPDDVIVHRSIVLPRSDLIRVGGIPCVTVERTLVDLGAVVSQRRVAHALDTAIRNRQTDFNMVAYVHARRRGRGRRGAGVLARVLEEHHLTGATESPYERDLVTAIMEAGLPLPRLQYEVRDGETLIARCDLAWPAQSLIVEVDGHGYHSDRGQRAHDATRQNRLTQMGWSVLRFTTDQIFTDCGSVLDQIDRYLRTWVT